MNDLPHFDLVAAFSMLVLIGYAILMTTVVASIATSRTGFGLRLVWLVVVCGAPFLGSALWFVVGRPGARREGGRPPSNRSAAAEVRA
ncbi:PLD nuclease N-terminal domain-containing protein [Saccharopolyspora sp. NPDC047091]|uniref:PLD nuclease N-terminal domain-containing protein n=1 Tax=Saccharopolyspora sp. NPDC047091 TaxID=3155924 RepID=UPI0033D49325